MNRLQQLSRRLVEQDRKAAGEEPRTDRPAPVGGDTADSIDVKPGEQRRDRA